MADYPTSVKVFTTKVADQVIDPAHINDIQDEINAVETGLLNGFAHDLVPLVDSSRNIGSSALQWKEGHFSSLYVAGAAVGGAAGTPDAARIRLSTAVGIAAGPGSTVTVEWSTSQILTNSSMWDNGVNRAFVYPQSTGLYLCLVQLHLRGHTAGISSRAGRIFVRDSSITEIGRDMLNVPISTSAIARVSALKYFDVADGSTQYIQVEVENNNASSITILGSNQTFVELVKL